MYIPHQKKSTLCSRPQKLVLIYKPIVKFRTHPLEVHAVPSQQNRNVLILLIVNGTLLFLIILEKDVVIGKSTI